MHGGDWAIASLKPVPHNNTKELTARRRPRPMLQPTKRSTFGLITAWYHYTYLVRGEERIVPVPTLGALIMSRCINLVFQHGQKTRNKILTDHLIYFLSIGVVVAHFLRPEHLGQHHRRCPPRPRNCDHNAHYSDRRSLDRIAGGVGTHFALMDRVLRFPGRLVQG